MISSVRLSKTMKINNLTFFLLLLAFLAACSQYTGPEPQQFKAYENNPILGTGESGEWDALSANTPDVVFNDSVFYLFYTGSKTAGNMSVGLAISYDGYNFKKYSGNPLISPSKTGFDAYAVGASRTIKDASKWRMFYNAMEIAGFSPGPYIGIADATFPTGPWIKHNGPVLSAGRRGEWDDGFIIPCSVFTTEEGRFLMYYTGGRDYQTFRDFYLGLATSHDGISWKKYNDPSTGEHPFKDSDPVVRPGKAGDWDDGLIWLSDVKKEDGYYSMYYTGIKVRDNNFITSIGYATSSDGIHWHKYHGNPVITAKDDPYLRKCAGVECIENPSILKVGNQCFMYYDYGGGSPVESVGVAATILNP